MPKTVSTNSGGGNVRPHLAGARPIPEPRDRQTTRRRRNVGLFLLSTPRPFRLDGQFAPRLPTAAATPAPPPK